MRKVLLLAALCMALALVLSTPVMAQTSSASAESCNGGPTRVTPDGIQCSSLPDVIPGATASASASASASADGVSCDQFIALGSGEFSQYQAQQYFDFVATPEEQAILDPDGNGFACDGGEIEPGGDDDSTASASASASASVSASALPETGGPVSVLALVPLALLVGAGILALRVVRRS